jgi:hypothetical protein
MLTSFAVLLVWATAIFSQPASSATVDAERTLTPDARSRLRRRRSID